MAFLEGIFDFLGGDLRLPAARLDWCGCACGRFLYTLKPQVATQWQLDGGGHRDLPFARPVDGRCRAKGKSPRPYLILTHSV